MSRRTILFVIAFISSLIFFSHSSKSFAWTCAFEDTSNISKCPYSRPSIDTIKTFAIFCSDSGIYDSLATCFRNDVWQMDTRSVPQFLWDNSMGKCSLSCDVISRGPYPIRHPTLNSDGDLCTGGGTAFATYIFQVADSTTNFALYDEDQDGIVDGFFFIILHLDPHKQGCPCLGDFSYKTNDTTSTGDTVWVLGERGVEVRMTPGDITQDEFVHICVHEWGHQFGLVDLFKCVT